MENVDSLRKSFKDMLMEKNTLILRLEDEFELEVGNRGHFGHIVMVVNVNKPLIPYVGIDGRAQVIKYEGLLVICYGCGCYGHSQATCSKGDASTAKGNKVVVEQHTGFEAYDEGKLICNTRCMPTGVNLCKIIAEKPGEWFRRNLEQDKKKGISLRDIKKKDFKVRKRLESIHIANNHVIEWVDSMSRELEAYGMGGPSVGECNKKNENLMEGLVPSSFVKWS
ncbi:hypothetical protein Goarm_012757 [Gossypium armourianum]|uniref:CCHC-type domain-containing protein n=1 Tax=Gossypium armourianum TaxID=34283 RepID=A0A7J9J0W6_9ROSI|nr:hypothetical protein [Gossypium armourianum]